MTLREILWLILIGILLSVCLFLVVQSCNRNKVIADYTLRLNACLNAPKTVDTVHVSIIVKDTVWIRLKGKVQIIHDTTVKWCQVFFDSTYKFTGGRIHYQVDVKDCQTKIRFLDIVSPKEIVTITNRFDTCISKPPEYKAKLLHWGLYTDLSVNNFKQFPGIGLGGQIVIKDQITIGAGAMYADKFYCNLRIGILLKK